MSTEPVSAPPIDLAHLRRYTLGDLVLEAEILALFHEQMRVTLAELQSPGDTRRKLMAAHTLKGSARAVGAWRLAELAEDFERASVRSDGWPVVGKSLSDEIEAVAAHLPAAGR